MRTSERFDRRALRESIAAGAVVALVALVAGLALALSQHQTWTAESVVVVLPQATLDNADSAAYYETLSRGQIVATFAEVAGNLRFEEQAEDRLQLTDEQREGTSTEVSVVPDTSVILVRASSQDAGVAERMADATTALASEYLSGLSKPYRTDTVKSADRSAYSSGISPLLLTGATIVVALVAGLAVQQAVYHLAVAIRGAGDAVSTTSRVDPPVWAVPSTGSGDVPAPLRTARTRKADRVAEAERARQKGAGSGWWS